MKTDEDTRWHVFTCEHCGQSGECSDDPCEAPIGTHYCDDHHPVTMRLRCAHAVRHANTGRCTRCGQNGGTR